MPSEEDDRLAVDVRPLDGATVLTLAGELDHDTAEPLREALEAARADGGRRLLVDVTALAFCDSTGLNVLLHNRLAARETGGTLELIGLRKPVARMFHVTGADGLFPQHPDVQAALASR
ncbi:STAS domain-containing protein [Streptomyces sp. NBC_00335]|uniref:STAS domain-containing protein n=1 Tax=unclassified Streptomyces TaxID=2593676 RepID=UPI00224F7CF2|nr:MULTISPECIES: STAS domain-containing protein [unclassified Streptomyces]MCX5409334.1 STAS domain-containing protein [Streptomyces sp. NBC_00086]